MAYAAPADRRLRGSFPRSLSWSARLRARTRQRRKRTLSRDASLDAPGAQDRPGSSATRSGIASERRPERHRSGVEPPRRGVRDGQGDQGPRARRGRGCIRPGGHARASRARPEGLVRQPERTDCVRRRDLDELAGDQLPRPRVGGESLVGRSLWRRCRHRDHRQRRDPLCGLRLPARPGSARRPGGESDRHRRARDDGGRRRRGAQPRPKVHRDRAARERLCDQHQPSDRRVYERRDHGAQVGLRQRACVQHPSRQPVADRDREELVPRERARSRRREAVGQRCLRRRLGRKPRHRPDRLRARQRSARDDDRRVRHDGHVRPR